VLLLIGVISLLSGVRWCLLSCDAEANQTIQVIDSETSKGHTEAVLSVAFSPNGKHIVSCGIDKTIRVWESLISDN
jgi:WD40 repeat protein